MSSYQYRKSHYGDKTILRPFYLHNGISHTGKTTSLYWIRAHIFKWVAVSDYPILRWPLGKLDEEDIRIWKRFVHYWPFMRGTLQWRNNEHDSVSNHQPHVCLLNRLFGRRSKKTSKLRVTGLCVGNSPGTGEFPAQMTSNAENVSIWWRHHDPPDRSPVESLYKVSLQRNCDADLWCFFDVSLNSLLNKKSSDWWFGRPRSCDVIVISFL